MTIRLMTAVSVLALVSACSSQPGPSSLSATDIGYNAYRAGDYAAAEAAYSSALAANRGNEAAMLGLAEVYEITGRASEAAALYREINATRTGAIRVWNDGRALQDGVNEVAYRRLGAMGHQPTASYAVPVAPAPTAYSPAPAPTYYSEPAPTTYAPAPAPTYYSAEPAPTVYSPAPTVYTPEPVYTPAQPVYSPAPAPTIYSSEPVPVEYTPAPAPTLYSPAPAPTVYSPAPAPTVYSPAPVYTPAPVYSPTPASAYDTPAPLPEGYNPAPNYSLGQDGIVEYAEPRAPQYAPQPVPVSRRGAYNTDSEVYYTDPGATQRVQEPVFDRFDAALDEAIQGEGGYPQPAANPTTYAPAPINYSPAPMPVERAPAYAPQPSRQPSAPFSAAPLGQPGYGVVDGNFVYISAEDIANGATAPSPTPAGPAADSYGIPVPVTGSAIPAGTPSSYSAPRGVDVMNGIPSINLN